MKRMSPILFLLLLLPFARANAQQTARDAYLEAWFQETAEGNLEAALREYKQCVTLAGDDRELAARASWRMARIARARGDEETAKLQLQKLIDRYPDTKAASAAQADLAGPAAGEQEGREAAAVEEARRMLREMLGGENVNSPRARTVFRTLSVEEIVATQKVLGGGLGGITDRLDDTAFTDQLVELLARSDDSGSHQACLQILQRFPSFRIPERLRARLPQLDPICRPAVVSLLISRPDGSGLPILRELIDGVPMYRDEAALFNLLKDLLQRADSQALPVLDQVLDLLLRSATSPEWMHWWPTSHLLMDTVSARHALERLGEFPAAFRLTVATEAVTNAKGELPRAWLDRFLADAEPLVRQQAILGLFLSGDPERRREGIDRFLAEANPYDLSLVEVLVKRRAGAPPLDELMSFPEGVLREAVYWFSLADERRSIAQVLRFGLDRKDPELLHALLFLTFASDPDVNYGRQRWNGNTDAAYAGRMLAQSLSSTVDANLGRDLTNAVSARMELELRRQYVDLLKECWRLDSFAGAVDQMANDPSATVRLRVLELLPFDPLHAQTRVARLLDADPRVASLARARCSDPEALAAACASADLDRLDDLCQKALDQKWPRAVRAAYERLPDGHPLAVPCFEFLWQDDLSILLRGLRRLGGIQSSAWRILQGLPLPEDLGQLVKQTPDVPESVAALADELAKRLPEVEEAFRVFRVEGILQDRRNAGPQNRDWRLDGERLAALNARGELVRLAHSALPEDQRAGAAGMVKLGMKDELLAAIRDVSEPSYLLVPALQLGLGDELIGLVRADLLVAHDLAIAARDGMRGDVLARLLLPEGDEDAPGDLLPNSTNLSTCLGYAADFLTREKDAAGLVALVERYGSGAGVNGLLQLQAYDRILAGMGRWTPGPVQIALAELHRLTGLPETDSNRTPEWPQFQADQQALIEAWRKALLH
ncbi:MAG: hypothetical protein HY812_13780 [Planctomycetes bacterium]|nr:hypothetical protein [Planctomycetota bacterium]